MPGKKQSDATFSRRGLLVTGVGLAAAACAPGDERSESVDSAAEAIAAIADDVGDPSRVLGRIGERGVGAEAAEPTYFQQPPEMATVEAVGEQSITLDVDYLSHVFVKRKGTIVRGQVRAYNNSVPGPTIRCDPGEKLNITLNNNLPAGEHFDYDYEGCRTIEGDLSPAAAGLPHAFNTTNLHTHGLHVSPKSLCGDKECGHPPYDQPPTLASDDVFIDVPPGKSQDYCICLPDFHAPGTHWYHAHKHGSTALQVNNGLAGALIVNEVGDQRILGNQPHQDQIFLIQEIMETEDNNDQLVYADVGGPSSKFFVNGVYQPTLRMKTGEVQRWRFINATSRPRGLTRLRLAAGGDKELLDTSDLDLPAAHRRNFEVDAETGLESLQGVAPELLERAQAFEETTAGQAVPMSLIAVDGISFYGKAPRLVKHWDFAPGNRADFLVKVKEPGIYRVVKAVHEYAQDAPAPEVQTLAYIEVTRGRGEMAIPDRIPGKAPCYLRPIEAVDERKKVTFEAQNPSSWDQVCPNVPVPWTCAGSKLDCDGTKRFCDPPGDLPRLLPRVFTIDCERFEPDFVDAKYTVKLDSAEEWALYNTGGGAHPFHIHVNPFQVVEIFDPKTGKTQTFDPDKALWQDVVAIPRASGGQSGYVKIRQRFLNFAGDFVIHCHFLNHEDLGMMKRVRVLPTRSNPGYGPCEPVKECRLR